MSAPAQPPTEGAEGAAPGGGPPGPPPNTSSNRRLQQTQAQVEEVVDIMRVNVDKVLKRDEILSELDDRADALQMGASQFESSAAKLKRKYWWKNCKMMIMLGAICAIIVVVISTFLLEKLPPLSSSPLPPKLLFLSLLFSQHTSPSTFLHPSPGFSIVHFSFSVALICTMALNTRNAAPVTVLK
ncbi:vesicle-associated membrane protein 1 isoform X1 [Rhinolophus ferrumequinum]|uniref:vesicle-associated membrane protein 1 isoform X1 n=1 Tax=Rhinolophus ferrumequinum TaxID=59479 RepID=UPI00140F7416|nr:vesicle-associated membrane protein 1 isoform X1 [Rhinolophus ferrumequinum]